MQVQIIKAHSPNILSRHKTLTQAAEIPATERDDAAQTGESLAYLLKDFRLYHDLVLGFVPLSNAGRYYIHPKHLWPLNSISGNGDGRINAQARPRSSSLTEQSDSASIQQAAPPPMGRSSLRHSSNQLKPSHPPPIEVKKEQTAQASDGKRINPVKSENPRKRTRMS